MEKMKTCKFCGNEIASGAKTCPACGGKNKPPIYKRWWFIVIAVILLISVVSNLGESDTTSNNDTTPVEEEIEYTKCSIKEMDSDLEDNAAAASEKYKGKYISIKGSMEVVDSDGKYISLHDPSNSWDIIGVKCYIRNDKQLEAVKNFKTGDIVRVKGKVTSVGEILGYSLNMTEIPKKVDK